MFKKLFNGAKVIFIGTVISKALAYLFTWLGTRLGPYEFGIYSLGFTIAAFVSANSLLGMDAAVTKFAGHYKVKNDSNKISAVITSVFKTSFVFSVFLAVLLFIFAPYVAHVCHGQAQLVAVIRLFAVSIPFSVATNLLTEVFRAYQQMDYYIFFRDVLDRTFRLLLLFVFHLIGYTLFGFVGAAVVSVVLTTLLILVVIKKKVFDFKIVSDRTVDKEIWSFSMPRFVSSWFLTIMVWFGTILIGIYLSPVEVGLYTSAVLLTTGFVVVSDSIFTPLYPMLIDDVANNKIDSFLSNSKKLYKVITLIFIIPILTIFLLSKEIMLVLFGREYLAAGAILFALSVKALFDTYSQVPRSILTATSNTKVEMYLNFVVSILFVALCVVLIPKYGMIGAAWSGLISSAIIFLVSHEIAFRRINYDRTAPS